MKNIQEVFDKIQKLKKEQREIRKDYKYMLDNNPDYEKIAEKLKTLREKKKDIEDANKPSELEELADETKKLNEMLSDIAMTTLMDGKSVYVKDKNDTEYEPVYKVTFKKMK